MILDKNIKIDNNNGSIKFKGVEYIDYGNAPRFYNYIRIILNNNEFSITDKQFFISLIETFKNDEKTIYADEEIKENDLLNWIIYKRNNEYGRVKDDDGNYFFVKLEEKKKKTTKLEDLIINSSFEDIEKQDYLVMINLMDTKEKNDLKNILLEEKKIYDGYFNEEMNKIKKL